MIAGVAKAYTYTFDYILYEMTYANLVMYSSVLPSSDDEEEKEEVTINADDPKNKDLINHELFD
jgi:pyruvoyl-dependent arginine decarboxylase (PvlArgDC)